jgi:hypothetical protein
MNPIRRYTLHPFRSRHNPLTRVVRTIILFALAMGAIAAGLELVDLRATTQADRAMIVELTQFAEGDAKLVEVTGKYAVERTVNKTTYEVR